MCDASRRATLMVRRPMQPDDSFKPNPLRGSAVSGVRQLMRPLSHLLVALALGLALASCVSSSTHFSRKDFIGVSCSSEDGGKTCFGHGETYEDGTSDSCGRIPNGGPDFALKLVYEISGNKMCETVVKTTHPHVMGAGYKFCSIYLSHDAGGITYRFTDDEPTKVRRIYRSTRANKWCQPLIDSL